MVCRISHSTVLGVLGILYTGEAAPPDGAVLRVLRATVRPIVFAKPVVSLTDGLDPSNEASARAAAIAARAAHTTRSRSCARLHWQRRAARRGHRRDFHRRRLSAPQAHHRRAHQVRCDDHSPAHATVRGQHCDRVWNVSGRRAAELLGAVQNPVCGVPGEGFSVQSILWSSGWSRGFSAPQLWIDRPIGRLRAVRGSMSSARRTSKAQSAICCEPRAALSSPIVGLVISLAPCHPLPSTCPLLR